MFKIFDNIKNFKKNYQITKASPYRSLVIKYKMTKYMAVFMGGLMVWRLISSILSFINDGKITNIINGVVVIIIGLWFVQRLLANLDKIKKHMDFYEKNGDEVQGHYDTSVNVKAEINDLLTKLKDKEVKNVKVSAVTKKNSSTKSRSK